MPLHLLDGLYFHHKNGPCYFYGPYFHDENVPCYLYGPYFHDEHDLCDPFCHEHDLSFHERNLFSHDVLFWEEA